jgi:hypothetical protein
MGISWNDISQKRTGFGEGQDRDSMPVSFLG